MSILGDYLKKLRGNESLRSICEKTGISYAYWNQLERGVRENPHPEILKKISSYFQIPMIELLQLAGYLDQSEIKEETYEQKVNRCYLLVINDSDYQFGTRLTGKITTEVKRFIIEMYEKTTKKKIWK